MTWVSVWPSVAPVTHIRSPGTNWECRFLGPTPEWLNQHPGGVGLSNLHLKQTSWVTFATLMSETCWQEPSGFNFGSDLPLIHCKPNPERASLAVTSLYLCFSYSRAWLGWQEGIAGRVWMFQERAVVATVLLFNADPPAPHPRLSSPRRPPHQATTTISFCAVVIAFPHISSSCWRSTSPTWHPQTALSSHTPRFGIFQGIDGSAEASVRWLVFRNGQQNGTAG